RSSWLLGRPSVATGRRRCTRADPTNGRHAAEGSARSHAWGEAGCRGSLARHLQSSDGSAPGREAEALRADGACWKIEDSGWIWQILPSDLEEGSRWRTRPWTC